MFFGFFLNFIPQISRLIIQFGCSLIDISLMENWWTDPRESLLVMLFWFFWFLPFLGWVIHHSLEAGWPLLSYFYNSKVSISGFQRWCALFILTIYCMEDFRQVAWQARKVSHQEFFPNHTSLALFLRFYQKYLQTCLRLFSLWCDFTLLEIHVNETTQLALWILRPNQDGKVMNRECDRSHLPGCGISARCFSKWLLIPILIFL